MTDTGLDEHILYVKEQTLRFAPPKNHTSTNDEYGKGSETHYGHVKVENTVKESENPVKSSAIISFVENKITTLSDTLTNNLQEKLNIINDIDDDTTESSDNRYNIPTAKAIWDNLQPRLNILNSITSETTDETDGKSNIPTAKAVWNALSSYKDLLVGVDLSMPKSYKQSIDTLDTAGYYILDHDDTAPKYFIYGGSTIYYTNGLATIKTQSDYIIQEIQTTKKENGTYKISGAKYIRRGKKKTDNPITWEPWHALFIPKTETSRPQNLKNVDSIKVFENTNGFIIQWTQTNGNQNSYSVSAPLYEYTNLCEFNPPLPISGPYIFSNLIGRMDIKITADKMQIRSNIAPGGRIVEVNETFFVPRD
ncbi:MAG: hypothetical protein J6A15_00915 [Clostridia bacterium]|nr:hypothetical protein [Clostridia bacterium]